MKYVSTVTDRLIDFRTNSTGSRWVELRERSDGTYALRFDDGAHKLGHCTREEAQARLEDVCARLRLRKVGAK